MYKKCKKIIFRGDLTPMGGSKPILRLESFCGPLTTYDRRSTSRVGRELESHPRWVVENPPLGWIHLRWVVREIFLATCWGRSSMWVGYGLTG